MAMTPDPSVYDYFPLYKKPEHERPSLLFIYRTYCSAEASEWPDIEAKLQPLI
jgi:hypothetical protein